MPVEMAKIFNMEKNWERAFRFFIRQSTIFLVLLLVVRFYELIIFSFSSNISKGFLISEILGLKFDLNLFFSVIVLISILIIPLARFYLKLANIIYSIIILIIVSINILLAQYFYFSLVPLDQVIFNYPLNEIFNIISVSVNFNFFSLLPFLIILIFAVFLFRLFNFIKIKEIFCLKYLYPLLLIIALIGFSFGPNSNKFSTELNYFAACNKFEYFIEKSASSVVIGSERAIIFNNELVEKISTFKGSENSKRFLSDEYPLLYKADTVSSISRYFEIGKSEHLPNIVFIFVESLSAYYSGPEAEIASFTPFLDSLSEHGLYWENCLSTSERTINVLPSVIGSLPYPNNGFLSLAGEMPNHFSIIRVLKRNSYTSNFFYGGDITFDNMNSFLARQHIDNIFSGVYLKNPDGSTSWGSCDEELLMTSFKTLDSINYTPRVDCYLTLSTHGPFFYPNKEAYEMKFKKRVQKLMLNKEKADKCRSLQELLSAVLYTDDAIKQFINKYKSRKGFNNTIFIITGDHSHGLIKNESRISRYHVPLIIYSPLLKKSAYFESVVSHLDITPTLVALLNNYAKIKLPKYVHWLGHQLDTVKQFRSEQALGFLNIGRDIQDYLYGDYYLSSDKLFKINKHLVLTEYNDTSLKSNLDNRLQAFKLISNYTCFNKKVVPDSAYNSYQSAFDLISQKRISINNSDSKETYKTVIKFKTSPEYISYTIKLECKAKFADTTIVNIPKFVIGLSDSCKNLYTQHLTTFDLKEGKINSNEWRNISVSQTSDAIKGNCNFTELLAYLYNFSNQSVLYKDLKLTIVGERKFEK